MFKLQEAPKLAALVGVGLVALVLAAMAGDRFFAFRMAKPEDHVAGSAAPTSPPVLDRVAYDSKMLALAHVWDPATGPATASRSVHRLWPVKTVYPDAGALLPFHRVVAYYGNFYSSKMGILGQVPPREVLRRLLATIKQWAAADPSTPVIPAIDYIVESAQGSPGPDHLYLLRMPDKQVDKALAMANQVHGLLFLDFQVGSSTVQREIPRYARYLAQANVEVCLDPEFSMKHGLKPGTRIGTLDASDINWVARLLAKVVKTEHLPPKILVVHRFTHDMVTNYKRITPLPEVQIVMDMDGWGTPKKKIGTYESVITSDPVQFTGFKLFFKNDLRPPSKAMLTPWQVLKLVPAPSYIQYQ